MSQDAKKKAEQEAAERREDYVRALREEREGYVRRGLDDRAAQVAAEIKRVSTRPVSRAGASKDDA